MSETRPRPSFFIPIPSKQALRNAYVGLALTHIPSPALILDLATIRRNAARMAEIATAWDVDLRVHVKTHKTAEGTREMIGPTGKPGRVIVSTLAEAWGILDAGLVKEGIVGDILYGLPVSAFRLPELTDLRARMREEAPDTRVRLLVDDPEQIKGISESRKDEPWSLMVKVDCGGRRAGLPAGSQEFSELLQAIMEASDHVELSGFYSHAGHSYGSRVAADAEEFLTKEVQAVIQAATIYRDLERSRVRVPGMSHKPLILSVGSTPTAHAASRAPSSETLTRIRKQFPPGCTLELHAGNYPFLDLQQLATKAQPNLRGTAEEPSKMKDVAVSVLCSVVSTYPKRREALIDAGGIAFSKDRGPWDGFGDVVHPASLHGWKLGRASQEHGILTSPEEEGRNLPWVLDEEKQNVCDDGEKEEEEENKASSTLPRMPRVGEQVLIVPQHACMTMSAHPFYFIIDTSISSSISTSPSTSSSSSSNDNLNPTRNLTPQNSTAGACAFRRKIVDIWVPWKGW